MTRNAKACLASTPIWSLAYSLCFFFLSLYFRARGVDDAGLGRLVSIGAAVSILFSFLSAFLVDRMGRRLSTLVFDLVGSALPFLLYALDGGFASALLGTILANSARVMNVGFALLMTEDAGDGERARSMNVFNLVYVGAGLFVPLAGSLADRIGVVAAERWFLYISTFILGTTACLRYRFTRETAVGETMRRRFDAASGIGSAGRGPASALRALLAPYGAAWRFLRADRGAAGVVVANILFYVFYSVGTTAGYYFAPFFADVLGMDPAAVGRLGAVFAGGTLLSMALLDPWLLVRIGPRGCSLAGAVLSLLAFFPLVFMGPGRPLPVFLVVGAASLGFGMLKSGIDAALSTCFGVEGLVRETGSARSGAYAGTNLASSALVAAFGVLAGRFYAAAPRLVPVLSVLLLAATCASLALSPPGSSAGRRPRSGASPRRSSGWSSP